MKIKNTAALNSFINLFSVNFKNLLTLPCHVFWKNIEGTYLGYNDYGASNLGYNSGQEIAGKSDYEIFPAEMAALYRTNDTEAIKQNRQIFAPEKGVLKNNAPVIFLSYKMPFYNQNKIVGVFGIAFTRSLNIKNCDAPPNLSPNQFAKFCNGCPKKSTSPCLSLSDKEKECLRYLCQGLTIKMIARQLGVSPKTVETHMERAKVKMGCHNKIQLVLAFIKHFGSL